jgi:hypothetical protein
MLGRPPPRAAAGRRLVLASCISIALGGRATAAEPEAAPAPPAPVAAPSGPHAPELGLAWQAPEGCPTALDVETQFVRLLGGATRTPSGKHIEASALVRSSSPDHWSLELATTLDGAPGRRNLTGDSCGSVSSAAALILALMIDPAAAERALLAPTPRASEPPAPTPRAPEAVVRAAPPPEPSAVSPYARAYGGAVVHLLPDPAPAAGVALGASRRWLAAELSFVATTERRVSATPFAGGDFRLLVGGARACGALGGLRVVWQLCAGGELERLTGTGIATPAQTQTVLMGAGTAGLLVTVPLGARFGLTLDAGGALRVYHPGYCAFCAPQQQTGTPVFRIPSTSAFAAGGLLIRI